MFYQNLDNNNGTSYENLRTFMISSRSLLFRMRNISVNAVHKIKTLTVSSVLTLKSCLL